MEVLIFMTDSLKPEIPDHENQPPDGGLSTLPPAPSPGILDDIKQDDKDKVEFLRSELQQKDSQIEGLRNRIQSFREEAELIASAVAAVPPYKPYEPRPQREGKHICPVLMLSDWHIGEVIDAAEVENVNKFDFQIAEKGILGIVDDFLRWVELNRSIYTIDQCAIFSLGDFVSGNIHDELLATNEFPLPVQTAKAGVLLGECLRRIASRFVKVELFEVAADNHGRLVKKPQAKQRSSNNMSYLVYTVADAYASHCKNIEIIKSTGTKMVAEVGGKKFLLEHGESIRGWQGTPYYGMSRSASRESVVRMGTSKEFDYMCIGHFHVPAFIEDRIFVNGSLTGTTELDRINGRFARPSQVAFMVNSKYGPFDITAFRRRT
jgi:predicted phosphodiesterase